MTDSDHKPDTQPAAAPAGPDIDLGGSQADGLAAMAASGADDVWAEALAEQAAAPTPAATSPRRADAASTPAAAPGPTAQTVSFPSLDDSSNKIGNDISFIKDIPVQLTVELGRTRMTIKNLLQLGQGSVVELDGLAGEPMDIFVNGFLIAQGEVVVVEDRYGIRLTDIITPTDRLNRLNGRG